MKEIFELIKKSKKILLLTHENPDGDAIGSVVAFYNFLKDIQKDVNMVILDVPPIFNYFDEVNDIKNKCLEEYDLGIVVDCSSIQRIGQECDEFERCKKSIVIDHHVSNEMFGTFNVVDKLAPSCTQIIYDLFKSWNVNLTKKIGYALLTGCLTDTNGFSNSNVNQKTFLMVAELMKLGIDIHELYYTLLLKKSKAQHELMKMTVERLEFFDNGRVAFSYISHEDMENVGAKCGEHEGLVDIGRNISGVEISIFMREDNGYNVSFRSNGFDVANLASKFNGGGHKVAAGAKLNMGFKEAKETLINATLKELEINERNSSN